MNNNGIEIERKYLIKMPDMEKLRQTDNYDFSEIEQVYVSDTMDGMFGRIRKRGKNGVYKYYKTFKKDVTAVTRIEIESEISEKEYKELKKHCREGFGIIEKTRHVFAYKGQTFELDIFPFWNDKAFDKTIFKSSSKRLKANMDSAVPKYLVSLACCLMSFSRVVENFAFEHIANNA